MTSSTAHIDVPVWLQPAVIRATEQLPEGIFREMGQRFPGGFTKRAAILVTWKSRDHDFGRITREHAGWLRQCSRNCALLELLDPAAIDVWMPILAGLEGAEAFALALWLDPRDAASRLATAELLKSGGSETADPQAARDAWRQHVWIEFLQPFGIEGIPAQRGPDGHSGGPVSESKRGDSELERTQGWLRKVQTALTTEKAARAREVAEMTEANEAKVNELSTNFAAAQAELMEVRSKLDARVDMEVAAALDAKVRPWRVRVVDFEKAVVASATEVERLSNDVETALERQRQADRHHGNRAAVRKDLELLVQRRNQIQMAAADALHPLSEWPALLRRIDAAIARRRELLGEIPTDAPPWMFDLAAELAMAPDRAAVDALVLRVEALGKAGLVSQKILAGYREQAAARRWVFADPHLRGKPVATVAIGDVIRGAAAGVILVDAYNWIGRAGGELGVSADPARFSESLNKLHPLLRQLGSRAIKAEVLLIADGPDTNQKSLAPNLRVAWSGGHGRNRADQVLIGELLHLRSSKPDLPVFVVTEDREIVDRAAALGAEVQGCIAFARRLNAIVGAKGENLGKA